MYSVIVSVVVVAILQLTEARIGTGSCAKPPTQQNFNLSRYLGQWYGQVEYSAIFNVGVSCSRARYSLKPNGHLRIFNQGYYRLIDQPVSVEGEGYVISESNPATLSVTFFNFLPAAPYLIVETDYDNYSVVYSCKTIGFLKSETAWVLTRSTTGLSEDTLHGVLRRLESYGIESNHFSRITQTDCPL
ncbi:hypothetical protein SNE40_007777 [Patella caerulea]|uniref:Apolipoprotein D n=1 Tax=Patella caerulea TaxID=87958 RepID=A0AAN8K594_PATCE